MSSHADTPSNTAAPPGALAGRREFAGLAVLALAALLMSLDLSVLYLALPHLSTALSANSTEQLWVVDIYGFMTAGFLITMGSLGDRVGRRKLLLLGAALFGITSVVAAFSTSFWMLFGARALMGVAAATVMPCGLGLISHMFAHPAQRGMAIASWMSCFMGGLLIGPIVGGVLLRFFWWGSVFLIAVPVMLLLLLTGPRLLPEYRNPQRGPLDLASVGLSLAGVLLVIFGLKELAKDGWAPAPIGAVVLGLVAATAFVLRQRSLRDPMLDTGLFSNQIFAAAVIFGLLGGAVQGGSSLLVTLHLQTVEGLSTLGTGLWMLPPTLGLIVGLMLGPGLAQRIRPAYVLAIGMVIAALGYVVLTQVTRTGGLAPILIGFGIVLFGVGIPLGLVTGLAIGAVSTKETGSASAVMQTGSEFGVAFGIAALGSVAAAVYRTELTDALPSGVTAEAARAARGSVEAAEATARSLPSPLGSGLVDAAHDAFTAGLNTVALVGAIVVLGLAVLSVVALRKVDPVPPPPKPTKPVAGTAAAEAPAQAR
ncbi:MFS transporter [Micromonospora sp. NPDC051227]|uniref:MFS transporter n=1 Tax=Micromonospora sp. NPDC051227 TaxID=3364285 RepID=UPI0037BA1B94